MCAVASGSWGGQRPSLASYVRCQNLNLGGPKVFPAPSPAPPSAQPVHSQRGRTLARGRPARQGPERAGADSGRRG